MDVQMLLIFFSVVFVAALIHGISGFAFGIVMLMVLPHLWSYSDALALTVFLTLSVVFYNAYLYRKEVNWTLLPIPFLSIVFATTLAVKILKFVGESSIWYMLLGIVFCILAVYMIWGQSKITIKPTVLNAFVFCMIGGFINGLFGVGGPIVALYFLAVTTSKEEYLGSTQVLFALTTSIDFILRCANGMITETLLIYGVSCLWCVVLGLLLGRLLIQRISEKNLRMFICGLMVMNAVLLFMR